MRAPLNACCLLAHTLRFFVHVMVYFVKERIVLLVFQSGRGKMCAHELLHIANTRLNPIVSFAFDDEPIAVAISLFYVWYCAVALQLAVEHDCQLVAQDLALLHAVV